MIDAIAVIVRLVANCSNDYWYSFNTAPTFFSLSLRNLQFDVIAISVLSHADPEFPAAGLQ